MITTIIISLIVGAVCFLLGLFTGVAGCGYMLRKDKKQYGEWHEQRD
jgi:hypothetical protein